MQLIKSPSITNKDQAVIYEVNLTIANDVIDEFDAWLQKHIEEMLAISGFKSASTSVIENNDEDTKQRCVQYRLVNQTALDSYFENDAERMRADGLKKFPDKMTVERRILTPSQAVLSDSAICANCGTQLEGRFCSSCGQREESRVPTFISLIREASNTMFGLESKLWQSIYYLLLKPGHLTVAYLTGQRQKFTTPFRLFFVFVIVTFAYLSFLGNSSLSEISVNNVAEIEKEVQEIDKQSNEADGGVVIAWGLLSEGKEKEIKQALKTSLKQISEDLKNGNTERIVKNFIQPLPKALLLFLPFIAFACKVIYLGRGKYYVEHLIFLLHNHSFLFTILLLTIITSQLSAFYPVLGYPLAILINLFFVYFAAEYFINKIKKHLPERKIRATVHGLLLAILVYAIYQFTKSESIGAAFTLLWAFYVPYYLYRSMRNVYKSSRFVTLISYSMIAMAYLFLFMLMLVIYIVYSGYFYS